MEIFQRLIQLYILFGAINIMHSTDNCYCHEDCDALANVVNQQNQLRRQPGPDKRFLQNEADTSTCKRNTKCCVRKCPKGWIMNEASCFMFVTCTGPCSTNDARDACSEKGAQLAKVSSAPQEEFFFRSLDQPILIIGGSDSAIEGIWRWPDGSLISDGYSNWKKAQPNGGKRENCMFLYRPHRQWYDVKCGTLQNSNETYPAGYICETSLK